MSQTDERPRTARRRGRPVGSDSVVTRGRILDAARRVINQRGYPAATFQAIAVEADLSRPTLHYYFSSREEIYDALVAEAGGLVAESIANAPRCDTLAESLAALVTAIHDTEFHDASQVAFLISARLEASRNPSLGFERGGALRAHLVTLVTEAVDRGELVADTRIGPIADMLHSVLWGVGMCAGFLDERTDMTRVTRQLGALFAHGLVTGPAAGATSSRHVPRHAERRRRSAID